RRELGALVSYREKDDYLGGLPGWQIFRVAYLIGKRPVIIGGLALVFGYCWAALRRIKRPVSRELMRFHRREQMRKLGLIIGTILRGQKVDSFCIATEQ